MNDQFELIRPYNDEEVKPALERVMSNSNFKHVINYLYESCAHKEIIDSFGLIDSVSSFQKTFSDYAVDKVIEKTSGGLTFGGLENLEKSKPYLFIANHRDIVLDAAFLQSVLIKNNFNTTQITFGSNLMSSQFIIDLGKMNKMFTFYRGGSRIEQYQNAILHSKYIHFTIEEKKDSIWIAQRDGRTKNGNDRTQIALIKMLSMGYDDICDALKNLNIVPVSISYEYEPCDHFKVKETIYSQKEKYIKAPNEDLESVLYGITSYKGKIHLEFGKPLNDFINQLDKSCYNRNEIAEVVVKELDYQILTNFKLNKNNYISYDLMHGSDVFLNKYYSIEDLNHFVEYVNKKIKFVEIEEKIFKKYFYEMYATPIVNQGSSGKVGGE